MLQYNMECLHHTFITKSQKKLQIKIGEYQLKKTIIA